MSEWLSKWSRQVCSGLYQFRVILILGSTLWNMTVNISFWLASDLGSFRQLRVTARAPSTSFLDRKTKIVDHDRPYTPYKYVIMLLQRKKDSIHIRNKVRQICFRQWLRAIRSGRYGNWPRSYHVSLNFRHIWVYLCCRDRSLSRYFNGILESSQEGG